MKNPEKERRAFKKAYKNSYIKIALPDSELEKCFYCGEWAFSIDHVPPITHLGDFKLGFLIPACQECNCILNDRRFNTLGERCEYIKRKLKKRYGSILYISPWSNEEIDELDGRLKEYVSGYRNSIDILLERLGYKSSVYKIYEDVNLYELDIRIDQLRKNISC